MRLTSAALAAIMMFLTLGLPACRSGNAGSADATTAADSAATATAPRYARGFTTTDIGGGVTLLDISDPEGNHADTYRFALAQQGATAAIPEGYERIEVPVTRAVCMTSLQLSNFLALGEESRVAGITSTRHLRNKRMKEQLASGHTAKIGIEGNFDTETLLALDPEVILISPFKRGGFEALKGVGVPLIPHLGYKELTPLGQAEWVKVTGLLTGQTARADSLFSAIESRYNALCALVDSVDSRPVVMTGELRGGNWYAQGGRSFLARLIADAGATYFLRDNEESGGVTLDYETVFALAADAPFWRIVNSYDGPGEYSYSTLRASDERYTDFRAWRDQGVIYCNMDRVPFYESMPVEPDLMLADFIYAIHPDVMPAGFTPTYYKRLTE